MALEVKKTDRESSPSVIRRFTKKVQQSGVLVWARKRRFHEPAQSRPMQKRAALRREKLKKDYERRKKLGLLKK